jgi:murein L,D-transpeptidase YafK
VRLDVRRAFAALAVLLLVAGIGIVGWDFLQLGRKIPELLPAEDRADLIRVDKTARTLALIRGTTVLKTYQVSLGGSPEEPKSREGDGRTPEGKYLIDSKNGRSRFHLALHISYPNGDDRLSAPYRPAVTL